MRVIKIRKKMKRTTKMIQTAKSIVYLKLSYFVVTWGTPTKAVWIDLSYQ